MTNRPVMVKVVAAAVLSFFSIGTWVTSGRLDVTWLQFFSGGVFAATALLTVWDLWAWKLPLAQRIPGVPTSLRGAWKGALRDERWGCRVRVPAR